jgi:hypothetical protein
MTGLQVGCGGLLPRSPVSQETSLVCAASVLAVEPTEPLVPIVTEGKEAGA